MSMVKLKARDNNKLQPQLNHFFCKPFPTNTLPLYISPPAEMGYSALSWCRLLDDENPERPEGDPDLFRENNSSPCFL